MKSVDLIVGSIVNLNNDMLAMQAAYFKECAECERLRKIIKRLKKRLHDRQI